MLEQACETCGRLLRVTWTPDQRWRITCRGPGGVGEGKMHDFQRVPVDKAP